MFNDHVVLPSDSLPDANLDLGASSGSGAGSTAVAAPGPRIPVHLWAKDPISLGGLTSALRFRPELELLPADDCGRAQVSVVATESLDPTAVSQLRAIKARGSGRTVLVVNTLVDDDMLTAVDAGVCAVVWRWEATSSWLSEVVVKAAAGEAALPSDVLSRLLKQIERLNRHVLAPRGIGLGGLSGREIEVLRLAADGLDTEEIALKLAYSARTVTSTLHDVMHRFQLKNRTQAVAYALREGLI